MPAKAKIDDQIMLELANKGLSTAEIARYFDVTHAAVRSKAVTLSKKHPDMMQIASRPNNTKSLPLCNRVNIELDRYMLESSNVQKHLAKLPFESTLDHLDQRNTVILKGLQILEKIQKIGNPQGSDMRHSLTKKGGGGWSKIILCEKSRPGAPLSDSVISIYGA
jgi:hypothetical protein